MKKVLVVVVIAFFLVLFAFNLSQGKIRFSSEIDWQANLGSWSAGIAWGDIDGNGWPDLVNGAGADVAYAPDAVYFNGESGLSTTPGWQSDYTGATCLIYLGDLDNNGTTDLIAPSIGFLGSNVPQPQVVYFNSGSSFPADPDWLSTPLAAWCCVAGDADGDGDLDIVFPDHANTTVNRAKMFINDGGSFDVNPGWYTSNQYGFLDAAFADIDLDGDLDLAFTGIGDGVHVFYNQDGSIETTPSWSSSAIDGGPQLEFGDVNRDGYPDLAVAGGFSGIVAVYMNIDGTLEAAPSWICSNYARPSGVAWGDGDGDGDLDLAVSIWQGGVGILENIDGVLSETFAWSHSAGASPQDVCWADYDMDNLIDTVINISADGTRKLFILEQKPLHAISSIEIDGEPLDYSQYCCDLAEGWISLASAPETGSQILINYTFSRDLDLTAVSTGVFIFDNLIDLYLQPFYAVDSFRFVDDNEDGIHDPGETTRFYFFLRNMGMVDSNVTITMTSGDSEIVFITPSVGFPTIEGDDTEVNNLTAPIEYTVPDVDAPRYDSFYVTIESDNGVYREIFGFEQAVGRPKIIIIDDDRGEAYEDIYESDLCNLGIPSYIWEKEVKGSPTGADLSEFHVVCWFTGDSSGDYVFPEDVNAMKEFLDAGGNLFLTGQGLAEELHAEDSAFLEDYLHARYSGKWYYYKQFGVNGSPIGDDLTIRFEGASSQSPYETDQISPVGGAQAAFSYGNTSNAYSSLSYSGDFKVVFFSWGYEALVKNFSGYDDRDTVMARILSFFPEYICGDVDNNEAVNLLDITFLISFLYKEGPDPESMWAADADGNGTVNILDITYLISFLYKYGPGPVCQ